MPKPTPKPIPFVDLVRETELLRPELDAAIGRVLDSGRFVLGPEVTSFEIELAALCQADSDSDPAHASAVGVSSGTDALLISLMALDIKSGQDVVTTPFTFFATAGVIARLGARPVFADIEEEGFLLDPKAALNACSEKTGAIVPVNLYGQLATLPETDIPIVEDSAQSIGAGGARGIAACFSFFPTKNVGAIGDAGAVVSSHPEFVERVRRLRTHGANPKYYHAMIGGNFRLDALQAALLRVKLRRLKSFTAGRRARAQSYRRLLRQATLPSEVRLPADSPEHVYHQFTIRVPRRDDLRAALREQEIATEIYYPWPLHLQQCFSDLGYKPGSLPNAESAAAEALSLPIHPALPDDVEARVVTAIEKFYK